MRIKTNQAGDFNVKGRIVYYFGGNQSTAEDHPLNLPIKVREKDTPFPITPAPPLTKAPGFEAVAGILGLVTMALVIKRKNE